MKKYLKGVRDFALGLRLPWFVIELGVVAFLAVSANAATNLVGVQNLNLVAIAGISAGVGFFAGTIGVYWHANKLHKHWAKKLGLQLQRGREEVKRVQANERLIKELP